MFWLRIYLCYYSHVHGQEPFTESHRYHSFRATYGFDYYFMTLPASQIEPSTATILLVDDEASNRDIFTQFLKLEGFRVVTAVDGEDALDKLQTVEPDLVLLDILLPRTDGYEVCRRIKENPQTLFLPVIMITALRGPEEKIRGVEVGADDFLSKPFNHLELVTRVKSLLRVKQLHDALERYNRELEGRVAERTAQLEAALDDLRELDRLKSDFIGNVSHELRTPLLHVKGYVSLLMDGSLGPLTEAQQSGLTTTQRAVGTLEQLIDDIVDFGGAAGGHLFIEAVSVRDAAELALQVVLATTNETGAAVTIDCAPDLPKVKADKKALARVLRHLLDNAIKFGGAAGEVHVRGALNAALDAVRIEVQDYGIGIEPEELDRIFDSFYQADGSTTRRYSGTGIGLSLVKRLLDEHESAIYVDSVPGKGSTFWFELPVATGD
ncbi:MAG: ATP-binding protein [Anaerolineales bacterium]